jgi:hypothetical protein
MASQSAGTGGDGDQVHPLLPLVPSIRGKANRHPSPRVFGSPVVLDDDGSRKQAVGFQDLLQQPSHPYLTGRANAGYAGVTTNRKSPLVSMAAPLPILVSDPNGCLTLSKTRAHFGIRSGAAKTWNEIMPYLRSWLQCVSRLRSFHCHQVRSKRERHLPFEAGFAGNIGPRINSPDTGWSDARLKISDGIA